MKPLKQAVDGIALAVIILGPVWMFGMFCAKYESQINAFFGN